MIIKILQHDEYIKFREVIKKFLIDSYKNSFNISNEYCEEIVSEKLNLLDDYIKLKKAILIGAIEKNILAGFIWVYIHNYYGELRLHVNHIVVDINFRKLGIGKRLLIEAEKVATDLGVKQLDLFVSSNNTEACNLYDKLGFGTERRYLMKKL